jgi:uncharacterized protein YjbI with pentapeptide repeats
MLFLLVGAVLALPALQRSSTWEDLLLNLGTEIIGAVLTYAAFEIAIGRRERREDEKRELVEDLRSTQIKIVVDALRTLQRLGWLTDGSLHAQNLDGVIWRGIDLREANLRRVSLREANLHDADLRGAILQDAVLENADLGGAKLQGTDLRGASLGGANLYGAEFDEATILSDGTPWTPGADF